MASKPRKTNVRKRKPISKNKRTLISVLLALALTALLTVLIVLCQRRSENQFGRI